MLNQSSILAIMAVVLLVATFSDIRRFKISNVLTFGATLVALILNIIHSQFDGFILSMSGFAVGLLLFLPFYALGGMAAGDVKLMAATGAFLGAKLTFAAVMGTILMGGILAFAYIVLRGSRATWTRYVLMVKIFLATRRLTYLKPEATEVAAQRFPYALAIASGTALGVWWITGTLFGLAL